MTENSEKKKPLIIESSDDSESSVESESSIKSEQAKKLTSLIPSSNSESPIISENKSPNDNSSSLPTSSSIPSSSSKNYNSSESSQDLNITNENLRQEYEKLNCNDENYYSKDCNKFLLKKELLERNTLLEKEDKNDYLYPNLNDKDFNIKIASKQEFNDTKYDGTIHEDIKKHADDLAKVDFELQPHQAFVKNFLSFQTP
jgi:hypothetical protein